MTYYNSTNHDGFQKYYNRLASGEDWLEWAEAKADATAVSLLENPARRDFAEAQLVKRLNRLGPRLLEPTTAKAMVDLVFNPDAFDFYKQAYTKPLFIAEHPMFNMGYDVLYFYQTWHKNESSSRPLLDKLKQQYASIAELVTRVQTQFDQEAKVVKPIVEQLMKQTMRIVYQVPPLEERLIELRAAQNKVTTLERQLQEARAAIPPIRAVVENEVQNDPIHRYLYEILHRPDMPSPHSSTFLHYMTDFQFELVLQLSLADTRDMVAARIKQIKALRKQHILLPLYENWQRHVNRLGQRALDIFQGNAELLNRFVTNLKYLMDATETRIFDADAVRGLLGADHPWETILQQLSEAIFVQFHQTLKLVSFAQKLQQSFPIAKQLLWEATTMMHYFQIANVSEFAVSFFTRVRDIIVQDGGSTKGVDAILELIAKQRQKRARLECSVCFTPTNLVCSQCKTTHYCGPACQKKDAHQHACVV